jgi:hypothetical protein
MKYLALCLLFFTVTLKAQTELYQLRGGFKLETSGQKTVAFVLQWSEKDGAIEGTYSDNHFTNNATVTGGADDFGRNFVVRFPANIQGVRTINILSATKGADKTAIDIPVTVVTRDLSGSPLTSVRANAQFTNVTGLVAQAQEDEPCGPQKFGALAGYCGIYVGLVTKEADANNRCDLLAKNVRLELTSDEDLILHVDEVTAITVTPAHLIGRLPSSIESTSIDVLNRSCRPLPGTTFPGDNCKRLNLRGDFTREEETRSFTGIYHIIDEVTNQSCRYRLSMNQEQ